MTDRAPRLRGLGTRLLASVGCTNLADGILVSALPLGIAQTGRSDRDVAFGIAVLWAPSFLTLLFGGNALDRFGVRLTAGWAQLVRVGLLGLLVLLPSATVSNVWLIAVIGGVVYAGEFLFDSALEVIVARSAATDDLPRMFGRMRSLELVGNRFVGPALGGVLVGISLRTALLASIALFAVSLALIAYGAVADSERRDPDSRPLLGLQAMRRAISGPLRPLAIMALTAALGVGLTAAMMVVFVTRELGLSAGIYGFLQTSSALGGVLSGLLAGRLVRADRPSRMYIAFACVGFAYLGIVATALVPVIYAAGFAFGVSMTILSAYTAVARQTIAHDDERGTVATTFRGVAMAGIPVGALAAGPVSELFDARAAFVLAFALHAVVAGILWVRHRRNLRHAQSVPSPAAEVTS